MLTGWNNRLIYDMQYTAIMQQWDRISGEYYEGGPDIIYTDDVFQNITYLDFNEFKEILKRRTGMLKVILNESIWENILKHIIDIEFCEKIIELDGALRSERDKLLGPL